MDNTLPTEPYMERMYGEREHEYNVMRDGWDSSAKTELIKDITNFLGAIGKAAGMSDFEIKRKTNPILISLDNLFISKYEFKQLVMKDED